jgi:pilus assembly protein CpaF
MLSRLETMVLMGMEIPLSAVQRQIASAIDVIVHLGRLRDKSRKVLEIVEVLGYENEEIQLQTLYEFREIQVVNGRIQGEWVKVHEIQKKEKLLAAGYSQI